MKVYCANCKYRVKTIPYKGDISNLCGYSSYTVSTPLGERTALKLCIEKNRNNDCPNFEEKVSWWRKFIP
jgi:hypothetical protein